MKSLMTSAAVVAVAAAWPAHAQNLDHVVVTAHREQRPIGETLADVTVIERDEIDRSAAAGLPELLRAHGALEISQNGGPGSVSGLFLRGTRTSQTLILVDGVRLENPSAGAATSNTCRCRRSIASRSCAGPRRPCTVRAQSAA